MGVIYRVCIKIGYCEGLFDFADATQAAEFARLAVTHATHNEDSDKITYTAIRVIKAEDEDAEE